MAQSGEKYIQLDPYQTIIECVTASAPSSRSKDRDSACGSFFLFFFLLVLVDVACYLPFLVFFSSSSSLFLFWHGMSQLTI